MPLFGQFNLGSSSDEASLKLECPTTVPEGYPYFCEPTLSGLSMKVQSAFSTPVYTLVDNTCAGLSVNSDGAVSAEFNYSNSDTCSYRLQITSGSTTTLSDTITLNFGPGLEIGFSAANLYVERGGIAQTASITLSEPSPFAVTLRYQLEGTGDKTLLADQGETGFITIPKGATTIPISFSVPLSASLTGYDVLKFRIANGTTKEKKDLNLVMHENAIPTFTEVEATHLTTCGISGGNLYCWGHDFYAQVGNGSGSTDNVHLPELISSSGTWTALSGNERHVCGLSGGNLYCWGNEYGGKLGNGGTASTVHSPVLIDSSGTWTHVAAGYGHTCGIDSGDLYCWGNDSNGQQGNGAGTTADILSSAHQWDRHLDEYYWRL
ncbi:MAG: hypothetical protein R2827_04905 [Bdellovibrionales bacterium]